MNENLFQGDLVCLKAADIQLLSEAYSRWSQDTEYWRLMTGEPSRPMSIQATREWLEAELYKDPPGFIIFTIHSLQDDRLIGEIGLDDLNLTPGEALITIGLGDRESWGKGFGTDAMRIMLRYAFNELNLRRLSLNVSEYNPRAVQSYRKVGFVDEGRLREGEHRAGQRFDLIYMGILREEWEQNQSGSIPAAGT